MTSKYGQSRAQRLSDASAAIKPRSKSLERSQAAAAAAAATGTVDYSYRSSYGQQEKPSSSYITYKYYDTASVAAKESPKIGMGFGGPLKSILKKSKQYGSSEQDEHENYAPSYSGSSGGRYSTPASPTTAHKGFSKPLKFMEKIKQTLGNGRSGTSKQDDAGFSYRMSSSTYDYRSNGGGSNPTTTKGVESGRASASSGYGSGNTSTDKDTSLDSLDKQAAALNSTNGKQPKRKLLKFAKRSVSMDAKRPMDSSESSDEDKPFRIVARINPSSPLEKIKGFFSTGNGNKPKTSSDFATDSKFGAAGYSSAVPSFRKSYNTSYRPHAYMPMTRYWYEDSNLT